MFVGTCFISPRYCLLYFFVTRLKAPPVDSSRQEKPIQYFDVEKFYERSKMAMMIYSMPESGRALYRVAAGNPLSILIISVVNGFQKWRSCSACRKVTTLCTSHPSARHGIFCPSTYLCCPLHGKACLLNHVPQLLFSLDVGGLLVLRNHETDWTGTLPGWIGPGRISLATAEIMLLFDFQVLCRAPKVGAIAQG